MNEHNGSGLTDSLVVLVPGGQYGGMLTLRIAASSWTISTDGCLNVFAEGEDAASATFSSTSWAGVIDDQHLQPETAAGALAAARRALAQIAHGCRDGWLRDPAKIARIASDGLMEVEHE